jgi:hypothetical protein
MMRGKRGRGGGGGELRSKITPKECGALNFFYKTMDPFSIFFGENLSNTIHPCVSIVTFVGTEFQSDFLNFFMNVRKYSKMKETIFLLRNVSVNVFI